MSTSISTVLLLVVSLLAGTVLGYAVASGRDGAARAQTEAAQWRARAEELSARAQLAEERADRDGSVLRALAPVRSQLEQVGARVEQMERQRAGQHASLAEQLRARAQAERELLVTTSSLASALRSRSSRGLWGEVELARVLEISGMMPHVDFSEQRSVGSVLASRSSATASSGTTASRPDVVIHLPAGL